MSDCKYGNFGTNPGEFDFTEIPENGSMPFNYENGDILVSLDQFGITKIQANPLKDIMLVKRFPEEKFSPWQIWIKKNGDLPVSVFSFPRFSEPVCVKLSYDPVKAVYISEYKDFKIKTEITIPAKGTAAVLKFSLTNISDKKVKFDIFTAVKPYCNPDSMAPWDKPEWYMQTTCSAEKNGVLFFTRKNSPAGKQKERRGVTFFAEGAEKYLLTQEEFIGKGSLDFPEAVFGRKQFKTPFTACCRFDKDKTVCGIMPVYAAKTEITLEKGETKTYSQVLAMQDPELCGEFDKREAEKSEEYCKENILNDECAKSAEKYKELFTKRFVKTGDACFDKYVNEFLPLQLKWVATLDRGWATGMRGVRDAANDYMGMLMFDAEKSGKVLIELFSCERKDGWFPRQISICGGMHDMRPFCDGGAFVVEFLYEYLCETGDKKLLDKKLPWLDGEPSSVYDHVSRAVLWYTSKENIGEHGLVKVYGGDWLDAINGAGLKGRGESVTVTCQAAMILDYAVEIANYYGDADKEKIYGYIAAAAAFRKAVRENAYNKLGFFNGYFTDDGTWLFSDKDADGEARMYGPSNYYAIISGAADKTQIDSVISNASWRLKCESGYRLFYPPLGEIPIKNVGRIATGDMPAGLWENGNVYNHGSHGFFARALSCAGNGKLLDEVINDMLPYDQKVHPCEKLVSPPYAVLNCYLELPYVGLRGGTPFLSGTVAMALRAVYRWKFGIIPDFNGLKIMPCLSEFTGNEEVEFSFRGKRLKIVYQTVAKGESHIKIGGGERQYFPGEIIPENELANGTVIKVFLKN